MTEIVMLTEHFSVNEFRCPCCGMLKPSHGFILSLEQFRREIDQPIHVASGFRCSVHNRQIGGSAHSQHLEGRAADIFVDGWNSYRLAYEAYIVRFLMIPILFGGIGCYPEHNNQSVHLDTRTNPTFWVDRGGVRQYMRDDEFFNFLQGKVKDQIHDKEMAGIDPGNLPGNPI